MLDQQSILVVAIVFGAALTRSTFGFGEALIAMPLLTLAGVDVKVAAPIVGLTSIVNALAILTTGWRSVIWSDSWRLVVAAMAGIPLGVIALVHVPEAYVKLVLAAVVICFALYNLRRPPLAEIQNVNHAFLFGFVAGMLGGAYGAFGPSLVIFGTLRRWPSSQFRNTLQAVFFPASLFAAFNHYSHQLWTVEVFEPFLVSLPFILLATVLGKWLHGRIDGESFARYIYAMLLLVGLGLVGSVVVG